MLESKKEQFPRDRDRNLRRERREKGKRQEAEPHL